MSCIMPRDIENLRTGSYEGKVTRHISPENGVNRRVQEKCNSNEIVISWQSFRLQNGKDENMPLWRDENSCLSFPASGNQWKKSMTLGKNVV